MGRLYDTYLSTVSTGVRKEKGTAWERIDGIIIPVVERYTRGGIRACMEI